MILEDSAAYFTHILYWCMYKYFIFQSIYFDEPSDKGSDDVSLMNEISYHICVKYLCY